MSRLTELPPLDAGADMMAQARANCAARLRARGHIKEAEAFDRAERDQTWAMRHEVNRLRNEAEKNR